MADEKVMDSDDDKQDDDIKKSRERTLWTRQIEFTLSCVGYAVSLGNIWRFPYLCMRNGGGAFLIPYFTCLLLCGMPLFLLELVLGQFASCGAIDMWNLCPLFKGVGWAVIVLNIIMSIYYNTIMGWVLYYLGMSMRSKVPWKTCNNTWNTPDCFLFSTKSPNVTTLLGEISHNASESNLTQYSDETFHVTHMSAAEEFFHNKVLDMSDGIHDLGQIKWDLMICLFVAGLSLYLCICKGVKSTGKVIYFSVIIPYIFLLILLVRGVTLPGSLEGIKYYIIPDWKRLTEFKLGEISHNASESNLIQYSNETFHVTHMSAAEEFFHNKVLDMSDGIHDLGQIKWDLMICLFVAGLSLYLCICKGVKSTGKVIYFSVIIPYIFLLILLVRGVTLPGSLEGIRYYIIPDWKRLTEFKVWAEACIQVFYSLGPGWGGLVSMASYNKFSNHCVRDAIIASVSCAITSFFAGFVIYSVIGFMAYDAKQPVDSVITQGPGLAFIAYPEAIANLPLSTFWAICFFLMLFFLGLDSQFVCLEVAVTGFMDMYPQHLRKKRVLFIGAMTLLFFLLGLPFVTQGGMYVFQIVDWYFSSVSLLLIAIFECLVVCYVYGIGRLYNDMYLMFGYQPSLVWAILWAGITPLILIRLVLLMKANHWWGPRLPEDRMIDKFSLKPHSWRQRFFIQPATGMTSQNCSMEQVPLKHSEKV